MSSFGPKRKARIIKVDHLEEDDDSVKQEESEQAVFKPARKTNRQTGLRKNVVASEASGASDVSASASDVNSARPADEDDDNGPAVVRPLASRSGSAKPKRRPKTSRISFGGDDHEEDNGPIVVAPKKNTLSARAQENSALRRNIALKGLPVRSVEADEERTVYSKEYLEELQNSTPITPQNISSHASTAGDEMDLDAAELEGAVIVNTQDLPTPIEKTRILSEAEIRERKERRARLAHETADGADDIIRLDSDSDTRPHNGSMLAHLSQRKKDKDTRLVREDEDLGEGFDAFVEDGGIALGRRAEREARRRRKQEIADMIHAAEGSSDDESSDEEAARRIAFEAAQSRAGLEGVEAAVPRGAPQGEEAQVPARLTAIPAMDECVQRIRQRVEEMRAQVAGKSRQVAELRAEKRQVLEREAEVQTLLDEAGMKYQAALGKLAGEEGEQKASEGGGQARTVTAAEEVNEFALERGLESLGARADEDTDMAM
ncbi:hypothetical protein TD95_001102 [Thielaviopsis punctulata]|uniref:Nineteen complex-related protein 2-domain-containing protein n=1 Tax=Thielaviopsis punctulata TaxID=72032 RepID=A0A0F4ZL61_9PEZI|nr:hypothetical protein TD95_001102 [Thielaviopsis punctulata]